MNTIAAVLIALSAAEGLAQEDSKRYCEGYKSRLAAAKSVPEKVKVLRELGNGEVRDDVVASALGRHLLPGANDPGFVLPMTAAELLGRFRGSAAAARSVLAALPAYAKNPSVRLRMLEALGRIGHEAGLPALEETVRGSDGDAASSALRSISELPPAEAMDSLFRLYDEMEKRKQAVSEEPRQVIDRVQPEALAAIHRLSGEKYPFAEMTVWWKRRADAFREESAKREKGRGAPGAVGGPLPAAPVVELRFRENMGNRTANTGTTGGEATLSGATWRGPAPVAAGAAALEWGGSGGAVDLAPGEALKGLKSFTVSGWLLATEAGEARRVLSWLHPAKNGEGVELARRADGSLQLGVNQPAESGARGPSGKIPLMDAKAANPGDAWRFFAVTYDGEKARFYSGSAQADVALDGEVALARGAVGAKSVPLTVGHVAAALRPMQPERGFRGAIDELRIFGSPYDGSGALDLGALKKLQNRPVTP